MSTSCKIISPSRSSNIIRVEGSLPHVEGSNDTIETRRERKKQVGDLIISVFAAPVISEKKTSIPLSNRNLNTRFDSKVPETIQQFALEEIKFSDKAQINVLNKKIEKTNTKLENRKGIIKSSLLNDITSFGISNTISSIETDMLLLDKGKYKEIPTIFKSPPDLNLLDEMYLNDSVSVEYYSSPNKISKNGLIEPLYIRETSTFEFNEKSFKSSLTINDIRMRSFSIKETIQYDDKGIEFYEDNIDAFIIQGNTVINNNFVENYNKTNKKFTKTSSAGKVHNNRILDMSWISNDNTIIVPYEEKYNTLKSEIDYSNYITLNNSGIIKYYTENNITISNQYPKIFEDKYSTGYTYDRSKVQGLDSIAFSDTME